MSMQSFQDSKLGKATVIQRLEKSVRASLPKAWKTSRWLLSIMIPVSFGVLLLDYSGGLEYISALLQPFFRFMGLPGESALVLLTSIFTNIYTAIAVITSMGLEGRVVTILAVMCLISHGFVIETAVLKKTGSSVIRMVMLRLTGSLLAGVFLNWALPDSSLVIRDVIVAEKGSFVQEAMQWANTTFFLCLKVVVLVSLLMILQKLLEEFGVIRIMAKWLAPLMRIMGLPVSTSFSWIVANTLGLAYGSAIMMEQVEEGKLSREEANLLNHHVAVSHSQLEDPLLFVAIGVPLGWMIWTRLILAILVVWCYRVELRIRKWFYVRSRK